MPDGVALEQALRRAKLPVLVEVPDGESDRVCSHAVKIEAGPYSGAQGPRKRQFEDDCHNQNYRKQPPAHFRQADQQRDEDCAEQYIYDDGPSV